MSREAKILIGILVVVVGGMIGLFVIANGGGSNTPSGAAVDAKTLIKAESHSEGSGSVQLVEFGDYQCPACGKAYPYVKQIMKDYNGKVTLYFRNFPLTNVHPNALAGANAAEAAAAQGKFWEMHDKLYEAQTEWSVLTGDAVAAKLGTYASGLGLDGDKLKAAVAGQLYKDVIDRDVADATTLQVDATPTFYVDGVKVIAAGEQGLRDALDAAVKAKAKK